MSENLAYEARQILRATAEVPEAELLTRLVDAAGIAGLQATALPSGYGYVARETRRRGAAVEAGGGETLFLSPHPSDVSGDFAPLLIGHMRRSGLSYRQVLLTRGEKGNDPMDEAEVIALRATEERNAAGLMGLNVTYLTRTDGDHALEDHDQYFPDGALLHYLPELTARLKAHIQQHTPRRLVIPSFYPDHPDHLATAFAAVEAVSALREEGFFEPDRHGPIEIYASDPEFAVSAGIPWARDRIHEARSNGIAHTIPHYDYRYRIDEATGMVEPAELTEEAAAGAFVFQTAFAVPPLIVTVPDDIAEAKFHAMLQHGTQMNGKAYRDLLPLVDRLRGLQVEAGNAQRGPLWGTGVYPLHIPGVTRLEHSLLDALPQENVYQLRRAESPGR